MNAKFIKLKAKKWINEKLINTSQARKICHQYEVDFDNPKQKNKLYNTLIILSYLFIGIALIILISENWNQIPRMLKTTVLIGATFIINAIAMLKYKTEPNKAIALFLLGAAIILIAQIYHLGEHMPDSIWWWAVGLLPFALLGKNNYLMLMPLLLSSLWFNIELLKFNNYKISYLLFIALSIYGLYKWRKNTLFFISTTIVILVYFLTTINHFVFAYVWLIIPSFLSIFYAFSLVLENTNSHQFKAYSKTLKTLISLMASFNLLSLTYSGVWTINFNSLFLYISAAIILTSASILCYYKRWIIAMSWIVICILSVVMQALMSQDIYALYMQTIHSTILVIFSIILIITGIDKTLVHYFFLGVINILLFTLIRYVVLFDGNYIVASILLITLAAIFLGSAKYWRIINTR